jgi:hypothetical protein
VQADQHVHAQLWKVSRVVNQIKVNVKSPDRVLDTAQ